MKPETYKKRAPWKLLSFTPTKDNFLLYQLLFENICPLYHHTPLHLGYVIY